MNPEALKRLWRLARPFALPAWLGFFALLCLAGLNPYFRPDYHDNITYYVAAESLLAGEGYTFQGVPIADWPPVTSVILAAVFAVFGSSIFAAKLVSTVAAITALLLADRLLRREGRPDRLKTIALFTLTPIAVLTATTVASDWICAAFSFGCLLALWHLRDSRSLPLAVATGLLLGLAALTRQTGVLLGAAIVAQAIGIVRKRGRLRALVPEFTAASIGASMYLGWGAYIVAQMAKQPPLTGNYANHGLALFTDFSLSELANSIFDLFWKWDDILERLGVPAGISTALLIFPSAILILGSLTIVRHRQVQPSDCYALAFLALIFGYHWKMGRYLLPIAPFLIAWFFTGLRCASAALAIRCAPRARRKLDLLIPGMAALWVTFLIPLNAYVLFNTTGNGAHRGISPMSSASPADYYQGRWADLHAACEVIKRDGQPGGVAASGFYLRYIKAFTGRQVTDVEKSPDAQISYTIFVADDHFTLSGTLASPGDTQIFQSDQVLVFRRAVTSGPTTPEKAPDRSRLAREWDTKP